MKYGRGKWVFGEFLLSARYAARRFTFGHGSAARARGSWRPLILQWRWRRRRREKVLSDRAATATPVFWFPQFHFHYATHLSNRSRPDRSLSSSPAAGGPGTRIVLDHRWTTIRTAELRQQPHRDVRPLSTSYAPQYSRPKIKGGLTNAAGWSLSTDTPPIAPLITRRPLAPQFGNPPRVVHAKGKTEGRAQLFQTHSRARRNWLQILRVQQPTLDYRLPHRSPERNSQRAQCFQHHTRTWQHWLQILRVQQPTLDYRLPHRSPERNSRRVTLNETEELLWQRPKRPAMEDADVERRQAASDSFDRPALRTFQSHEVLAQSPVSETAAALPITKLDPALVDRLTDDVIRRVEKRAQIERQRRGL